MCVCAGECCSFRGGRVQSPLGLTSLPHGRPGRCVPPAAAPALPSPQPGRFPRCGAAGRLPQGAAAPGLQAGSCVVGGSLCVVTAAPSDGGRRAGGGGWRRRPVHTYLARRLAPQSFRRGVGRCQLGAAGFSGSRDRSAEQSAASTPLPPLSSCASAAPVCLEQPTWQGVGFGGRLLNK
jgi:hypothetical protein